MNKDNATPPTDQFGPRGLDNDVLDMRHRSIIDALPVWEASREVLTVGAGACVIDRFIQSAGYKVWSTDFESSPEQERKRDEYKNELNFSHADIFDLSTFPVAACETVVCSEVLEHLPDWGDAFMNLLTLTKRRLIITVPWSKSYDCTKPPPTGHCNYWSDLGEDPFASIAQKDGHMPIYQFVQMAFPHHVSITKIVTKSWDWMSCSRDYLVVVDKTQLADVCPTLATHRQAPHVEVTADGHYQAMSITCKPTYTGTPPFYLGPVPPYGPTPVIMLLGHTPMDEGDSGAEAEFSQAMARPLQDAGARVHWWNTTRWGKQEVEDCLVEQCQFFGATFVIVANFESIHMSTLNQLAIPVYLWVPGKYHAFIKENGPGPNPNINLVDSAKINWPNFIETRITKARSTS